MTPKSVSPQKGTPQKLHPVSLRAVVLGVALIPVNAYWIMAGLIWHQFRPTTVSLFVNVVAILFVVTMLNAVVAWLAPRLALSQSELITVYVMLSISSACASLDLMQPLLAIISHPVWFASPENQWASLILPHIKKWMIVSDRHALYGYVTGHHSMYHVEVLRAWAVPAAAWCGLIFILSWGMVCINSLLRKEWTENARLSYPIIQVPLEITRTDFRVFRSSLLWIGLGVGALFDLINGLHFLYPVVPGIGGTQFDLGTAVTTPPWNAIGWTPLVLYPFAVGIGFFIPLDLAFSCWFFYLFWKIEKVIAGTMGLAGLPRFPYIEEQCFAGYVALCFVALWASRHHLRNAFKCAFRRGEEPPRGAEPMSYFTSFWGLALAGLLFVVFSVAAGTSIPVAIAFFLMYFILATAITRVRAELGSPVHDLHLGGPHLIMVNTLGSKTLGGENLTVFSFYQFFNRAYRGLEMPHQLEGFKLAERTQTSPRGLLWAILLSVVLGTLAAFWALLHVSYLFSAPYWYGSETFNRLATWIQQPTGPDYASIGAVVAGFIMTLALMIIRYRFLWFPLHPAGFVVSGSWSMNLFWLSLFIASVIKFVLIRYYGSKSYSAAIPFFIGIILGEFLMGSFWNAWGCIKHAPMYNFLP